MSKENIAIEKAVRKALGEALSDVSEELSSSVSTNGGGLRRSFAASEEDEGEDDATDIPPEVMSAVQTLCRDLSPEQATALSDLFEAIATQTEEEEDLEEEEPEEDGREALATSSAGMELSSVADAKAEGQRAAGRGIRYVIKLIKKHGPKVYRAAVRAAKRGKAAFTKWVNSLSNFNPLKWAIKGLPSTALMELIDWLSQVGVRTPRSPAAR